jgi:hypothetical protein
MLREKRQLREGAVKPIGVDRLGEVLQRCDLSPPSLLSPGGVLEARELDKERRQLRSKKFALR